MDLLLTFAMCMLVAGLTLGAKYLTHMPTKKDKASNTIDPTF